MRRALVPAARIRLIAVTDASAEPPISSRNTAIAIRTIQPAATRPLEIERSESLRGKELDFKLLDRLVELFELVTV